MKTIHFHNHYFILFQTLCLYAFKGLHTLKKKNYREVEKVKEVKSKGDYGIPGTGKREKPVRAAAGW
jgi:hypothetical protein